MNCKVGSYVVLKEESNEQLDQDRHLKSRTISDHVTIAISVKLTTMISIRVPRIDKLRMMNKIQELSKQEIKEARKNPNRYFKVLRNQMITNKISNYSKKQENNQTI